MNIIEFLIILVVVVLLCLGFGWVYFEVVKWLCDNGHLLSCKDQAMQMITFLLA